MESPEESSSSSDDFEAFKSPKRPKAHQNLITSKKSSSDKHIPAKLFKCHLCEYVSKRNQDLRRHEKTHSKVPITTTINCPELDCPSSFSTMDLLDDHLELFHGKQ